MVLYSFNSYLSIGIYKISEKICRYAQFENKSGLAYSLFYSQYASPDINSLHFRIG